MFTPMQRAMTAWRAAVVAMGYLNFDLAQVPGAAKQSGALSREWRQYKARVKRIIDAATRAAAATDDTPAATDAEASKRRWQEARAEEKEAWAAYEVAQRAAREAWEACQAKEGVKLAKEGVAS